MPELYCRMKDIEDKELVTEAQRRNHEAFAMLMKRHQDMLFAMILRQVGDRAIAEDLAQEVFIKAYRGLPAFRGDSKFSSWLVRIALNQTNSYFRSKRYKQSLKQEPLDNVASSGSAESAEIALQRQQEIAKFQKCLATLKPKYREVLVLCGLEGKSYEEAALIIQIPVGTVRSRLNKARLLAREVLIREGVRS
jgi:RNA polymerase sigma-70 factor, ECF subfamily